MRNTTRPQIVGRKGVIAAGHYLAASAGARMLLEGGNAVDAGVAAGFVLAVVKPCENSLGGECPILLYSPRDQKVISISGQGVAPGKATAAWFAEKNIPMIPGDGYLGATVPGLFGAYCTALLAYGRLTLAEVLAPAIEIARQGFPVYPYLSDIIRANAKRFSEEWPSTAEIFMPGGKAAEPGQILRQPALANTLERIAKAEAEHLSLGREQAMQQAMDFFYQGEIADDLLAFTHSFPVKDATGDVHTPLLEKEDFANYRTLIEEPVSAQYRDCTVFKCGPWTQGPVLLQQLKLLEGFDIGGMRFCSAAYIHLVIECAKLAFADRETYYGDPRFSELPFDRLLSDAYNAERRSGIDLAAANNSIMWEGLDFAPGGNYTGDTTHLDVIDSDGLMMSAMPSGAWIPSSPVVPKLGFPLGTRGQMFNFIPGHPNCIEPGKRPRTTLTPGLAFKDGKPWMVFGSPGGDCQDQWALQFLLKVVDFKMDLQEAMDTPSFYCLHFMNSFYPRSICAGTMVAEETIEIDEILKLQKMGHTVKLEGSDGSDQMSAVAINHETGRIEGAASAKRDGQAYVIGF